MKKRLALLIFSFLICPCGFGQTTQGDLKRPDDPHDGITTSTLEDVGMNRAAIKQIIEDIDSVFYPNRQSLLIYKQ